MKIQDKVALVTGGGRGIGEAIALALAKEGAHLAVASRTQAELDLVVAKIQKMGRRARAISMDVSRWDEVSQTVEEVLRVYGQIDILVNAAGVHGPIGPMWELDVGEWTRAIHTNLVGTFLCCRSVIPHMIERQRGKIINFSGGGATSPLPRFTAYAASKAAIVRLTETLAEEVEEFNIQVNAVAPGIVDTHLQDQVLAAGNRAGPLFNRIQKLRASGEGWVPRELPAELTVYLASDESNGLTGKLIAAPYDGWQKWNADQVNELMLTPWFTLRRMDPFTLKPLMKLLEGDK